MINTNENSIMQRKEEEFSVDLDEDVRISSSSN